MAEEKTNTAPMQENNEQANEATGWKSVQLTSQMPLDALVGFLNVLNQRLVNIEDTIRIKVDDQEMSLTEIYEKEAKVRAEEMAKQANEDKGE